MLVVVDRNFLLTPQKSPSSSLSPKPQLVLTAPSSSSSGGGPRIELSFKSSLPSVQIYSAPGLDGSGPTLKRAHQQSQSQSSKKSYGKDGALFIEFQQPVGTLSHTCAEDAKEGNELKKWLEDRNKVLGYGEERSWEKDSLVRRGQVWESWVEVEIKELQ